MRRNAAVALGIVALTVAWLVGATVSAREARQAAATPPATPSVRPAATRPAPRLPAPSAAAPAVPAVVAPAMTPAAQSELVATYCATCHSERAKARSTACCTRSKHGWTSSRRSIPIPAGARSSG
jgi:hypothetical protein